ncbi:hypothetical protein [Actinomadura formosensis]|uniref:hypothetical protein n=1 Tax=Actinomadura formosensis TaxID=60706 RepID=UPI0008354AEB|nr:hypothetical protein [Actinomadura formosensis]
MTAEDHTPAALTPSAVPATEWRWAELPPADVVEAWERLAPGTFARIMASIEQQEHDRRLQNRHERILDWIDVVFRAVGLLCAISAVVAFVFLARYFVDHGAATQAVGVLGGAAGIVGVFVARYHKSSQQ